MAVPTFLIKHGSVDFLNKQKNLFDILNAAEKETKPTQESHNGNCDEFMEIEQKSRKRKRKETKHFRGKESLFKASIDIPLKFIKPQKLPDFQRNPEKWVKYSLADITQDDMSNESNTAAALTFLREIKMQKKLTSTKIEQTDEDNSKPSPSYSHKFNLPPKQEIIKNEPVIDDRISCKPVFKSSKLIMPEYVVGQIKKEKKYEKKVMKEKGKEIYLNHIHEYDDE